MSRRSHRHPTPEELRLWHAVARTATPIGRPLPEPPAEVPETPAENAHPAEPDRPTTGRAAKATTRPAAPGPMDRRLSGRAARGRVTIDARLDLHGMTQTAAHRRLAAFLHDAQAAGARLVLVITGKGLPRTSGVSESERGVLRRAVPRWLDSAELRPYVVGFGEAGRRHGGAGALYVHVRRRRG